MRKRKLEMDRWKIGEEIASLENEKDTLTKGIKVLNQIIKNKLYIDPKTLEDLKIFFLTDEEDLILSPEKEEEIQEILNKYDEIISDVQKYDFYLNLVNLLNVLGEEARNFFPNWNRLKVLKNKAKAKLYSVKKKLKEKKEQLRKLEGKS